MSNFFDEEDIITESQAKKTTGPTTPSKSPFFDEEDVVTEAAPEEAAQQEPTTQEPTGVGGFLTQDDINAIAKRNRVDPKDLGEIASYFTIANVEGEGLLESTGKQIAGTAGRILGNIPQKIYQQSQSPEMQRAIEELRTIGRDQRGLPQQIAESVALPIPALKAASPIARIGTNAAIGAGFGYGESDLGQEGQGILVGAGIGTSVGLAGEGLRKILGRLPSKAEQQVSGDSRQFQFDIEEQAQELARRTSNSEKVLEELVTGRRGAVSPEDVNVVLREQYAPEALQELLDPSTLKGAALRSAARRRGAGEVSDQAIQRQLFDDLVNTRVRDFAEDVLGKRPKTVDEAVESLDNYYSRQGGDAQLSNDYKLFVNTEKAKEAVAAQGLKTTEQSGFVGRALNWMSDPQFVLRGVDESYGRNTEGVLRELNKAFNRQTFALQGLRDRQQEIFNLARKGGADDSVVKTDRIYAALDTGDTSVLSQGEKAVVDQVRKYFSDIRDFVNGKVREVDPNITPLSIPEIKNYVPRILKSAEEVVSAVEAKQQELLGRLSTKYGRELKDIGQLPMSEFRALQKDPGFRDLMETARLFDDRPIDSPLELSKRLKDMLYTRKGNVALETKARSAMERKDVIPDYLLEKNVYKLMRRYTDNTLKHLYLRKGIDQLRKEAEILSKAGADVEAQYIRNLVRDVMGVRPGTAAEAAMQAKIRGYKALDRLAERAGGKDTVIGGLVTSMKALPEIGNELTRQIYPNVLGYFNIRAVIQNLTQSLTKTAPELGGTYGYTAILRGGRNTIKNLRQSVEEARRLGNVPAEFIRAGEQAVAEGIQRSALYQIPSKALDGMGKAGMILYQGLENLNRGIAVNVGKVMASDLVRGSAAAQKALTRFPRSIRKEVARLGTDEKAIGELLSKYINDSTQYNYNRISLSEFGRVMGPLFSTFSKWPSATVGEVVQELRNKGAFKGMLRDGEKYLVPLILLQSIDIAAGDRPPGTERVLGDSELSDRQKKLLGSAGLSQSAPIGALSGIISGEIFSPPVVDAIGTGIVKPLLSGDVASLEKGAGTALMNFGPGTGLLRFLFDDLTTYITGERPEGGSSLERTIEGARKSL